MQNGPWVTETGELAGVLPPPPPLRASAAPRRRARRLLVLLVPALVLAAVVGTLLGGRAAAEDGRRAAAAALADGRPADAVALDEAVAARGGFLMLLDPGAAASAAHDAQLARLAWAAQLAAGGEVDAAVSVLSLIGEPALLARAAAERGTILLAAASTAANQGHAALALARLDEAARGNPPPSVLAAITAMRAADEVGAATELVAAGRAPNAVGLLDDATASGAGRTAAAAFPATLLAAAHDEIAARSYVEAASTLQRLVASFGGTAQAHQARALLRAPQAVVGTLVDGSGHPVAGRVRLSTRFTQLSGGYSTSGPFYYGTADAAGDFALTGVPVGGPYVLEYYRDGGWMTLVDPRTDQPANPVTVPPLTAADLTFIVLP